LLCIAILSLIVITWIVPALRQLTGLSWLLITIAVAGCADPAAEQARRERQADQINLFGDAATYYTCTHKAVQLAGECRRWWEAYEHDYAAFIAKYGER
jgi:hypothetical protein